MQEDPLGKSVADLKQRYEDLECEVQMLKQILAMQEHYLNSDFTEAMDTFKEPVCVILQGISGNIRDIQNIYQEEFSFEKAITALHQTAG